jgi:hypothetical protein
LLRRISEQQLVHYANGELFKVSRLHDCVVPIASCQSFNVLSLRHWQQTVLHTGPPTATTTTT